MKKATLLAMACVLFAGSSALAQADTQEVTYVEDPAQGYLFNKFKDNWFITGEGGVNMYFSHADNNRKTWDRFAPAAGLYVGKWFSPIVGLRAGVHWLSCKGVSEGPFGDTYPERLPNGMYKQKFNEVGPVFDAMISLTNWWCGYHPGRKYNAIFYAGAGGFWSYTHEYDKNGNSNGWHNTSDRTLTFRAGIINSYKVSEQVGLSLDLRWNAIDNHQDEYGGGWNRTSHDVQAYLGVTYYFKKREWNAPVVPVCPEPENCDALRRRIEEQDNRIKDLEDQLAAALNKAPVVVEAKEAPLATIYYPINIAKLTKQDVLILSAVSDVMKDNPDQKYKITGWADTFTGNNEINTRLRSQRTNVVVKQLVKFGVPQSQLIAEPSGNVNLLKDLGEKYAALDRATTIEEN